MGQGKIVCDCERVVCEPSWKLSQNGVARDMQKVSDKPANWALTSVTFDPLSQQHWLCSVSANEAKLAL